MAIKIMDSFEPAGSGFKVVDAKDISVTENVEHDLKYALKIIGYLLGLTTDTTGIENYVNNIHAGNNAKSVFDIENKINSDILALLRLIVGNDTVTADSDFSGKTLNDLKEAIGIINGTDTTEGSFAKADIDLLKRIIGNGESTDTDDRTLKALKDAIDIINGTDTDEGSFKKADADLVGINTDDISDKLTLNSLKNLLKSIIGDGDSTDLSGKTLKNLNDTISIINGNADTDGSFKKADKDLLKKILGSEGDVVETHQLNYLYNEIVKLQNIHNLINSVTYHAGVFNTLPDLNGKTTGNTINDIDNAPSFILKTGVVVIYEDKLYMTILNAEGKYEWKDIGPATIHESRFLGIENNIGRYSEVSSEVNNDNIWGNIAHIYDILGVVNENVTNVGQGDIKDALTTSALAIDDEGSKKIRLTKNFGKHKVGVNGYVDVELPTNEQSMTDFILSAFIEVLRPTVTQPDICVSQNSANLNFEIGSTYTPELTIKFNPGAYLYGPDTGVKFNNYSYKFNSGDAESKNIESNNDVEETLSPTRLTTLGNGIYKFTDISATYGDSTCNARSNIGDEYEDENGDKIYITGSTISNKSTPGINVYAPYYVKYYENAITDTILNLLNDTDDSYTIDDFKKGALFITDANKYQDLPSEITTNRMLSMLIAIPIEKFNDENTLTICNAANQLVKQNPVLAGCMDIKISGTNNYIDSVNNTTNYRIYYVNNDAPDSGINTYSIKYEK